MKTFTLIHSFKLVMWKLFFSSNAISFGLAKFFHQRLISGDETGITLKIVPD